MAASPLPTAAIAPPAPEECEHPSPVRGVMAHEFSHYEGARGPEGLRRTTTHFGPVIGGLPIPAWHCEACGLLRLSYEDGRQEERRLYPGPQPGLLAAPTAFDPDVEHYGLQARVSGLTVPPLLYEELVSPYQATPLVAPWRRLTAPDWNVLTWATVCGLCLVMLGLLAVAILATYDYQTAYAVGPVVQITGWTFLAVLLLQVGAAAQRHFFPFPSLAPPAAVTQRARPSVDGVTATVVTLLALTILGLFAAAILAVYTYNTSDAEAPIVIVTTLCAVAALLLLVAGAIVRRVRTRR
ncbi:MAG: hypothetical protein ACYDAC_11585 [Candidatus Dormibacteria bacterium]